MYRRLFCIFFFFFRLFVCLLLLHIPPSSLVLVCVGFTRLLFLIVRPLSLRCYCASTSSCRTCCSTCLCPDLSIDTEGKASSTGLLIRFSSRVCRCCFCCPIVVRPQGEVFSCKRHRHKYDTSTTTTLVFVAQIDADIWMDGAQCRLWWVSKAAAPSAICEAVCYGHDCRRRTMEPVTSTPLVVITPLTETTKAKQSKSEAKQQQQHREKEHNNVAIIEHVQQSTEIYRQTAGRRGRA